MGVFILFFKEECKNIYCISNAGVSFMYRKNVYH